MSATPMSRILLAAALLAACGGEPAREENAAAARPEAPAQQDTGIAGMGGMQSSAMMNQMMTHMQMMERAGPDSMKAMLSSHRQMTANMIAQMNQEMGSMNMPTDSAWTATMDSVRNDLTRLPELSTPEMQALMPAHNARIRRLMEMHDRMMQSMRR